MSQAQFKLKCQFFAQHDFIEKISLSLAEAPSCEIHQGSVKLKELIDAWWQSYLLRSPIPFQVPLNWSQVPKFSGKVLPMLQKIPFGTTITYREYAELAGVPKGARGMGRALAINPFPLVIPCHRVVGSSGLGGFSQGIEIKRILLAFEFGTPIAP
jgi:O-6-methylguanine DNA methyltransferase